MINSFFMFPCPSLQGMLILILPFAFFWSLLPNKTGAIMSCIGISSKKMCLDDKLERKIAEMRRYKFGQSKLKSVDSVVMLFPMFKERLKTLRGMFEQYGKFKKQPNHSYLYKTQLLIFDRKVKSFMLYLSQMRILTDL